MTGIVHSAHSCDHSACPAPAIRRLIIHGQDFRFCNHHAVEVEAALRWKAAANRRPEGRGVGVEPAAAGVAAGGREASR